MFFYLVFYLHWRAPLSFATFFFSSEVFAEGAFGVFSLEKLMSERGKPVADLSASPHNQTLSLALHFLLVSNGVMALSLSDFLSRLLRLESGGYW